MDTIEMIEYHAAAKMELDRWKKRESDLRIALCEHLFPTAGEGTLTAESGGYTIKVKFGINYKIDGKKLDEYKEFMTDEELDCIGYTPKLGLAKYKQLDADDKVFIDDCIVTTPAMPTLSSMFINMGDL